MSDLNESSVLNRTSRPLLLTNSITSIADLVIYDMSLPCECCLKKLEVPMKIFTPSTPVSTATLASCMWHLICVRILDVFNPNLQMASTSSRACSEATGDVNSM
ncbi:hypothetical protein OGAPHI_002398 [Ogataea philodendri]|uniref:Uncharacterized protein n=1 Tax=Ogataea philodendri TaxID=1378263 RepID=A0A9P8T7N5_9ASCO|nr:uncharacterized protein OGAPHI_002398 [Ogataea philodendri]KAH3668644.1 hypothetical protein OGAPHI_002398 [Ogataea philodendri]